MKTGLWARGRAHTLRTRASGAAGRGFTLIELSVASLLLMMAAAGIVPFFLTGLNQSSAVRYKSIATNVAREYMEEIRELDYREITMDDDAGLTLQERFSDDGDATPDEPEDLDQVVKEVRGIAFTVDFEVASSSYDPTLKQVTVTVSWAGPPAPVPASITTMIHQQYLGARGSFLEATNGTPDPLDTPFKQIYETTVAKYHLASIDWGLVFDDIDNPATSMNDSYIRVVMVDDYGQTIPLGDPAEDYKIGSDYLKSDTNFMPGMTDVWYEVPLSTLPFWSPAGKGYYDGYYELRATGYNEYDQPGTTWRVRLRVENGVPAAPSDFEAISSGSAGEAVTLHWFPGTERDRDAYVLERTEMQYTWNGATGAWDLSATVGPLTWDPSAGVWTTTSWSAAHPENLALPADTVSFQEPSDYPALASPATQKREYHYNLYAVDTHDHTGSTVDPALKGDPATCIAYFPSSETATTYTLNINTIGGGGVSRTPQYETYVSGTSVTVQAIPDDGYSFTGWSGDLTGSTNPATIVVDSDKTVTATFTASAAPATYQVIINNNTADKYKVTILDNDGNAVGTAFTLLTGQTKTITGLTEGPYGISVTRYYIQGKKEKTQDMMGTFVIPDDDGEVVLELFR